jgi:Concanavalin A-like lectin/glucanases superfamily
MSANDLPDPPDRLDSWKEIAAFLGRTVRTVQRWEKTAGLPVRRGGPGRGTIVASRAEVSEWWQRRRDTLVPEDDHAIVQARRRRPMIIGALSVVVLIAILMSIGRPGFTPASPPRVGRILAAASSEGRSIVTIPLGGTATDLEIAPDDSVLYASLWDANAVAVVRTSPLGLVRTIPAVERGWLLELSPDGRRLYVGGSQDVGVVDLARDSTERIPIGGAVHGLRLSPDGRTLWVALAQGGLKTIDTGSGRVSAWPTVGCPVSLDMDASGRLLFVGYQCGGPGGRSGHDAIEILDPVTAKSLATVSGPPLVTSHLTLSPDGRFLWAEAKDACSAPQYDRAGCPPGDGAVLHTFRVPSLELLASVRVPTRTLGGALAFVPDGTRILLSASGLHVVNAALGHVEERLLLANTSRLLFSRDASRLFVANAVEDQLVMLPLAPRAEASDIGGLGMHWAGDGTTNDSAGGTHAVDGLAGRYVPGRLGQAFEFGESSAPIDFGKRLDVDPVSGPTTFAAWIKLGRRGAMGIVSRDTVFGWQWSLTPDGRQSFCFATAPPPLSCAQAGLVGRTPVTPGAWRHVAFVIAADRVLLYQDAIVDAEATWEGYQRPVGPEPPAILRLGANTTGAGRFVGAIDEITAFRRALTPVEIARLMEVTTMKTP